MLRPVAGAAASLRARNGRECMAASTVEILNKHLKAFGERDMTSMMEDYTPDSFVLLGDGRVLRGLKEIQGLFEDFFAEYAKPTPSFVMHQKTCEGEVAFIVWSSE